MSSIKVIFKDMNEINDFVNIVNKYSVPMGLHRKQLKVGATSILGIINLGVRKKLDLELPTEIAEEVRRDINQYIVA